MLGYNNKEGWLTLTGATVVSCCVTLPVCRSIYCYHCEDFWRNNEKILGRVGKRNHKTSAFAFTFQN